MQTNFRPEDARAMVRAWWLLALIGVLSVVAGGILVAKPSHSLATLAVVFGIFVLLDGIVEVFGSFGAEVEHRGLAAVVGLLGIVVGLLLIRHPTHAVTAIGLLIGIWLVAAGVMRLARAAAIGTHFVWRALVALVEIAVGVAVVADPHIGYATLAVLAGIGLIVNGVTTIALALVIRGAATELAPEHPVAH